jgi:hypothetical protein
MSRRNPSPDVRPGGAHTPSRGVRRIALVAGGWTCVGLGVLGMALPLLPTTCFLLAAGALFAKSSPRAHHWLHHNRWFGRYLRDYREQRVIPVRVKLTSLAVLWATILATVVAVPLLWVRIPVLAIAVLVSAHVLRTSSRAACTAPETLAAESAPGA